MPSSRYLGTGSLAILMLLGSCERPEWPEPCRRIVRGPLCSVSHEYPDNRFVIDERSIDRKRLSGPLALSPSGMTLHELKSLSAEIDIKLALPISAELVFAADSGSGRSGALLRRLRGSLKNAKSLVSIGRISDYKDVIIKTDGENVSIVDKVHEIGSVYQYIASRKEYRGHQPNSDYVHRTFSESQVTSCGGYGPLTNVPTQTALKWMWMDDQTHQQCQRVEGDPIYKIKRWLWSRGMERRLTS